MPPTFPKRWRGQCICFDGVSEEEFSQKQRNAINATLKGKILNSRQNSLPTFWGNFTNLIPIMFGALTKDVVCKGKAVNDLAFYIVDNMPTALALLASTICF